MKRIISLIMALSIGLQIGIPVTWKQAEASNLGTYKLQWRKDRSLNEGLTLDTIETQEEEALVSWNVKAAKGDYVLEYYIEDEKDSTKAAERVKFTFSRDDRSDDSAIAKVEVFKHDNNETADERQYTYFNFDDPDAKEWKTPDIEEGASELDKKKITLPVKRGSPYPGGRIRIGTQMEVRFRWNSDDTIYFQTNAIARGNITPFSLYHQTKPNSKEIINILAGLDQYNVSPMHIKLDEGGNVIDQDTIEMPGDIQPGSKPGVKISFKRPRTLIGESGKFSYEETDIDKFNATLVISDLTNTANAQLKFNLGDLSISGLDKDKNGQAINADKELFYDETEQTYTTYLAEDDASSKNVVKWEDLKESLIFKQVDLSLSNDKQSFNVYTPIGRGADSDMGRYTYLGYKIERSSFQDAFIEIRPYKGTANTEFTYAIEFSDGQDIYKTLVEHKYMPTDDGEAAPFTVPVPFSSTFKDQYYRVVVKYSQGELHSQKLHYNPQEDLTIPPPAPIIEGIDNLYVVPPQTIGDQPETIGLDLTWKAPRNNPEDRALQKFLEKGDLYYELNLNTDSKVSNKDSTLINIFKVSLEDETKKIIVEPYGGAAGRDNQPADSRYNQSNDTFTMEKIVLKNPGKTGWEQIIAMDSEYEGGTSYPLQGEGFQVDDKLDKKVPGVYYLTMRVLYDPHNEEGKEPIRMGVSKSSNSKSISISPLEEVIPVPTKIESRKMPDPARPQQIIQSISWASVDLSKYKSQMLDPIGLDTKEDSERTYQLYLYQDRKLTEEDFNKTTPGAMSLDLTNTRGQLTEDHIKTLRNGKPIRIDYTDRNNLGINSIRIEGLDPNQVYYLDMRVKLDLVDKDKKRQEPRFSAYSNQHSFTTYSRPDEPQPGERVPPVPEELQIVSQPDNMTAIIGWQAPSYNKQEGEDLYYEMLRVDSRKLHKEEDGRMLTAEKLLASDQANAMEAWRTKEAFVNRYEKATSSWIQASPRQSGDTLRLEDVGLRPNKIYYYYVRTVLTVGGENIYSSWVAIPVTTDPIQKPIQLKVEDKDHYFHDPKREIVISFMAPVDSESEIHKDFDFDIEVKGEQDSDYRSDYSISPEISKQTKENIPRGYRHFVYKITDLTPGRRYDIKVRVIDKLQEAVDGQYPKSPYSDRVSARTHFDQEEQDKEDKFSEYIKYFEDRVEVLRRKPYWILDEGENTFAIKYRSNYIIPEMEAKPVYDLAVEGETPELKYYMPASLISKANLNKNRFEINQGDISYAIRPGTITEELEDLQVVLQDIGENRIKDYYVLFNVAQIPVIGSQYLTPQLDINIELVRLKGEDTKIDQDMMADLNKRIQEEKTYYISELEKALNIGEITPQALDEILDKSIKQIELNHGRDTSRILRNHSHRQVLIDEWKVPILVIARNTQAEIAEGYYQAIRQTQLPTIPVEGGFALQAIRSGIYGFTGQKVVIPVMPSAPGSSNLIIKYQLSEFFGSNGQINPKQIVTKRQLLGAMARVLGAPRGADYLQHLRQANIMGVGNIGLDSPIQSQEGIYLLMQTYEKTLRRPIATMHIKNRNAVPNIRAFNPIYQSHVLVAVDSKIITRGGNINPRANMKVEDVLQMLTKIMNEKR